MIVAPLDWGLGHTTRCIPIIQKFLTSNYEIFVACNNTQKKILEQEFNDLQFIFLKGYNIQYATSKRWLPFKILQQLPKILLTIKEENQWLSRSIENYNIDLVISDNRFGLYSSKVQCIFITHQLQIQARYNWLQQLIQRINYRFINRYSQCWVPDYENTFSIAGKLSHPVQLPAIPVKYIGPLSRLQKVQAARMKYKYLFLLSGPEPQRTILENKIAALLTSIKENVLLVRGKPIEDTSITLPENCTVCNHLIINDLQQAIAESEFIVSRAGYTTVMEILSLQKKAILIPTPGQTEQEYLGKHLMQQQWCYSFKQEGEDYLFHLNKAQTFSFNLPQFPPSYLEKIVENII